jgi:hypothetical protein
VNARQLRTLHRCAVRYEKRRKTVEANADFFVQKVLPQVLATAERMAPALAVQSERLQK